MKIFLDTANIEDIQKWRYSSKYSTYLSDVDNKCRWKDIIMAHRHIARCSNCSSIHKKHYMFECPCCDQYICGLHVVCCQMCNYEVCYDCANHKQISCLC